jgi:hypothetical protein
VSNGRRMGHYWLVGREAYAEFVRCFLGSICPVAFETRTENWAQFLRIPSSVNKWEWQESDSPELAEALFPLTCVVVRQPGWGSFRQGQEIASARVSLIEMLSVHTPNRDMQYSS